MPVSIHYSFSIRYRVATTRSACQTLACTQVTSSVHYELALTNATHNTCNVILLQASVKPCCDLPKQSTFPLLLLCLLYSNSSPHYNTSHTHKIRVLPSCSNAQIIYINRYVIHVYRVGNKVCTAIYLWLQVLKQRWGDNAGPAANICTNSRNESRDRSVGIAANY